MESLQSQPVASQVRITGAQAIVRVLRSAGVREAFGLASGKLSPLYRAMSAEPEWQYTGVRHEASAAFMATAVSAGAGRIALCLGETGPGSANLMSALGGAFANNLPLIAITSSNPAYLLAPSRGAFSSSENQRLFGPFVKWNATVHDVSRIPEVLHRALRIALSGRPGPVHLDVPTDVLAREHEFLTAELDAPAQSYRATIPTLPSPAGVAQAAELLASAKRPLLVAGGGVVRSGASAEFRGLVERLSAPAMATQMGLGGISADHPFFIGQGGFVAGTAAVRAIEEADVLLAVGCRFSSFMWTQGLPRWADSPDRKLVQIDIDPDILGQNVPLTLGLQGDARTTLTALLDCLPAANGPSEWTQDILAARAAHVRLLEQLADTRSELMHPAALAREIGRVVRRDDLVTFDGGHTSFWSNDFTPAFEPATRFHESGMAHLGFGLPWAIALARCFPDRRCFCLTGDGAFGFTLQELDTARRYGAKVVTVVHNNEAWGVIRLGQSKGGFELGTDLSGTDYAAIARGFGCFGERVERAEDVGPALQRAIASGLPAVLDARVSFEPHPMMHVFGRSTAAR